MQTSYFKKLTAWLRRNAPDLILVSAILSLCIFVAIRNYVPGTWLLGWDDLVPELNFKLNIVRSLSAVWQEYQGLGLLGGMAHSADLPRQVILALFSVFVKTSFLRYFWAFLMLCIGPLGTYLVVSRALTGKVPGFATRAAGLSSAVFYLFNLATVQTFYTPFETFLGFYGFLPWLLLFGLNYLENGGKGRLATFLLLSLLATGAFYVQTLFVVYAVFLVIFALETIIKHGKTGIVRSTKLGIVTLFVNAFWLLPVIYFSITSAGVPGNSHINSIATPETQIMNQARADFTDIATLKGYWFDYYDWDKAGNYDYLFKTWIGYTSQPLVEQTSLALFGLSVLGLILSLIKKKTSYGLSFVILLGISYFMLNGGTVPGLPYFSEIFRNAYTKWANAAAFIYAVGLGYLVFILSDIIKHKAKYILGLLIASAVIWGSIYSTAPIISGNLISDSMRVNLPADYLSVINYFKTQDATKRIADFPLTDFWGWKFTDWGYRGSWFTWYGTPQPVLDRTFDVWSPYNEAFYSEIAHAVETGNQTELTYVLNKYQVSYILFDSSVTIPGDANSATNIQKEQTFLESVPEMSKAQNFGAITIYNFELSSTINSFISVPQTDYSSPFIATGASGPVTINETFGATQGYQEAKNCDSKNQGSATKTRLVVGNYYKAENGAVTCDYFYYPTLDYTKAYSMRIQGTNISGRSLKFYLYDPVFKTIDMQELLPSGKFDKSYLVLPMESSPSANFGYTLSVETRSFGKVKSENTITGIQFSPVDYHTVSGPVSVVNNLAITNVQKYGTWAYKIDLRSSGTYGPADVQGDGLIELAQGYDSGWIAIQARDFPSAIFHLPLLEHFKADSWANGWVVPTDTTSIYIIYWPQFLEWGGMILGGFAFLLTLI